MKKLNKYVGLALAFSMLFSMTACKKSSSETTAASEKVDATEAASEETTEETTGEETTEAATSEETNASSDTTASDPKSEKDFEEDLYNFYASSKYQFPGYIYGSSRGYEGYTTADQEVNYITWDQQVSINIETWTLNGYYSADGKEFECHFKVAPVERVNDYSYRTTILETIDYNPDDFEDPFDFAKPPYSFSEGDEIVVYLPNALISDVPGAVWEAAINSTSRMPAEGDYLQAFVLYNESTDLAYDGGGTMFPVFSSRKLSEDEMKTWLGEYSEFSGPKTGELKIYKDPSSGEIRADYYFSDYQKTVEKWFKNLSVRMEVDNPNVIYAFGESEDGIFIILSVEKNEYTGRFVVRIHAYTPDEECMVGQGGDFEKTT